MTSTNKRSRIPWLPLVTFLLLALSIIAAGSFFYSRESIEAHRAATDLLSSIADLKIMQIENWRTERLNDGDIISGNPAVQMFLVPYIAHPSPGPHREIVMKWLELWRKTCNYRNVLLLDSSGDLLISTGEPPESRPAPHEMLLVRETLEAGKPLFGDICRMEDSGFVHMDLIAPLHEPGKDRARGVLLIRIDPSRFMFPLIKSWPSPSKSAETLLVRREGDDVLYLNELRHEKQAALSLHRPVASEDLPAAMAVRGREGIVDGRDYRGNPVLAALRHVPGTHWFVVAKIDKAEIFAPLTSIGRLTILIVGSLLLLGGLTIYFGWQRSEARLLLMGMKVEEERKFLADLLDHSAQPFGVGLPDGRLGIVNAAFCELTGYSREELMAMDWAKVLTPPEWQEKEAQALERLRLTGQPVRYEKEYLRKDGTRVPVELLVHEARDEEGKLKFYYSFLDDISERRKAEEDLKASERKYRELFDGMSAGVTVYEARDAGEDFIIRDFNRAGERITRVARDEVLGRSVLEVFPGVRDFGLLAVFRRVCETGHPEHHESALYKDERISFFAENYVYKLPSGEIVAVYDDITVRKKAEEEIRTLNLDLEKRVAERTNQLEAANRELEAFAYSVSHDLRAPLRGIDGWSQALLEDCHEILNDDGRLYLDRIRKQTQQMGEIIDALLELSRVSRAEMRLQAVDLSSMVGGIAEKLQEDQPERKADFVIEQGICVRADKRLMEIALFNLLDNAWKFAGKQPFARIEFGKKEIDGQVAFFIGDNGAGFDMAYRHKLFGAFQRLHRPSEFPGTGVGLATVQRIVHRHGGRIWAEAEGGRGATFYFTVQEGQ
jgi:PAS domain S-box-containing protein